MVASLAGNAEESMKTVLHIIERLVDFGGTPRMLLYLAAHNNHVVNRLVFAPYIRAPLETTLEPTFRQLGATVLNFDTQSLWHLVRHIVATVRATQADVICTHFTRPLIAGFLASRLTGLPLIHNEHSSAHYRRGVGHLLAQLCLPFVDAVICNSRYTSGTIAAAYRIAPDRLHVLYNPVEQRQLTQTGEHLRGQLNFGAGDLVIGHVGGMIPTRDQATLLKAFCEIQTHHPNARLVLIGDGPLRGALELLVRQLDIGDCVRFIGYTAQVGNYLGIMDIYVNTTLDEGFGIAVVEAMLAGLPVVLTDAGAHPELITDGVHGVLYTGGDDTRLAHMILELIDQPDKRRRLGDAARESACERFAPEHYVSGYDTIIDQVLLRSKKLRLQTAQKRV